MTPQRVYKYNIITEKENEKEVENLLSNDLFSKKIINPYANVGVIEEEGLVIQVQVMKRKYQPKSSLDSLSPPDNTLQLDDNIILNLQSHIDKLKSKSP